MMEHTLITIGRQFGSGGHEVGNRLAERLDIPLYDHNLLRMAARELGVSDEDVAKVDETMLGRFLSGYVAGNGEYTAFMSGGLGKMIGAAYMAKWLYPDLMTDLDPDAIFTQWMKYQGFEPNAPHYYHVPAQG